MNGAPHIPVLCDAVVGALAPKAGGRYVDGTFGAGGYSAAILGAADCRVWGIDQDPDALALGAPLAERFGGRLTLVAGNFGDMDRLLAAEGVEAVDGVALDLGVSSMQLDRADRGFSFRADGPLDMRMAQRGESAADLVNSLDEEELADIIYRYGEERFSRRIAAAIVRGRPFTRTAALAEAVRRAIPRVAQKKSDGIDPATRTFQALRIAVNDELGALTRGLSAAERLLAPGGRLAVVTFHSLEDRSVKSFLQKRAGKAPGGSRYRPAAAQQTPPSFHLLGGKPVIADSDEIRRNPRARSAKLRTAERTNAPAWPDALKGDAA
ncbi:MAG TPA: 16S rRNA (cytosine(1402)-N(4))-methyltransferase RsmH [Alphaproteobacteria bacterium]|nr:16S rRNA (cytosine(1402)-N(4))-methyltransferase RsmH [Alphaproteobacteria bacterium]